MAHSFIELHKPLCHEKAVIVQGYPVPKFSSFLGNIRSQFGHDVFMESNTSFDSRVHFRQLDPPVIHVSRVGVKGPRFESYLCPYLAV